MFELGIIGGETKHQSRGFSGNNMPQRFHLSRAAIWPLHLTRTHTFKISAHLWKCIQENAMVDTAVI